MIKINKLYVFIAVFVLFVLLIVSISTSYCLIKKNYSNKTNTSSISISENFNDNSEIDKKCTWANGNVGRTECVIDLLDRTAAEREWKQSKLENIQHPQVNTYDTIVDIETEKLKIKKWREDFEKFRDNWCIAQNVFIEGSGTPESIAECELKLELSAINDLNNIYYDYIMERIYDSQGISNFEPTEDDIKKLIDSNLTHRGCIWAGEEECN